MGVDYDSFMIIGYKINVPEDCVDKHEYVDSICKKVGVGFFETGNAFTGEFEYYIVPESEPKDIPSLHETINDLPRLAEALSHTGVSYESEPFVGALGIIW